MTLKNSVALLTGAASGLGNVTARALHERGVHVVLVDLPSSGGQAAAEAVGEGAIRLDGAIRMSPK